MTLRRAGLRRLGMGPVRAFGGFDAAAFGSPSVWLSAASVSDVTTTPSHGATVTQWFDSSGNWRPVSVAVGSATFDRAGYLTLSGCRMSGPSFARPADYTLYVLARKTVSTFVGLASADGASPRWWQLNADASGAVICEPFTGTSTYQGQMKTSNGVNVADTWYAMTLHRSAASGTIVRQNGTQILSAAGYTPGGSASSRGLLVGGSTDTTGTFTGNIAQVVLYPTAHDSTQMGAVETALLASAPA